MKKIYEKIKDILYDTFDYVVMIGIVFAVVAIIGWRLDVLFADGVKEIPATQIHTAVTENPAEEEPDATEGEEPQAEEEPDNDATEEPPAVEEPKAPPAQTPKPTGEMVKIEIPAGSHPGKIGSILLDAGLIDNSKNFIAKAVELGKENKLKAGTFNISKGSSYEEIIAILTK